LPAKRRKDPEQRRNDLIAAAGKVFAGKGVDGSTVSDIVKTAGVAQGTFYLYFDTKFDVINALVDQMIDGIMDLIERLDREADMGAADRLHALFGIFLEQVQGSSRRELAEIYHRPENREVHNRMAERVMPRLAPIVENIIRQGVDEGVFVAEDPNMAARYILGGMSVVETAITDRRDLTGLINTALAYALRSLGYDPAGVAPRAQERP